MPSPPVSLLPIADPARVAALHQTGLLDSAPEEAFDRLTRLASRVLGAPVALVTLVDTDRQYFLSQVGLAEPVATQRQTPLSHSFCRYVVAEAAPLVVEDARAHPLVCGNPAIQDLKVVAYLGVPLVAPEGAVLGAFCVVDALPRTWTEAELGTVQDLAAAAATEIALRTVLQQHQQTLTSPDPQATEKQALLDNALDVITIWDLDERLTYVNPRFTELLGYTPEEVLGREAWVTVHPEDQVLVRERSLRRLRGVAVPRTYTRRSVTRDGRVLHLESSVSTRWEGGRIVGGQAVMRDITDRVRAEQALQEREAHFRALIEQSYDGVVLVDGEARVQYVSPSMTRITGYTAEERIGESGFARVHPDDLASAQAFFAQVLGAPGDALTHVLRAQHNDGTWRTLEIAATNRLADPVVGGIVLNVRDVTERQAVLAREQALREVGRALAEHLDEQRVLDLAVQHAAHLLGAPFARVWRLETDGALVCAAAEGYLDEEPVGDRLPAESVSGRVVSDGLLNLEDAPAQPAWAAPTFTARTALASYVGAPLRRAGHRLGVIEAMRQVGHPFAAADEQLLLVLADMVAVAVDNARIFQAAQQELVARRQAEVALRASEERFQHMAEAMADVFWLGDPGMTRTLFVNSAYERIWGRTCASLYANPRSSLEAIHEDDRAQVQAIVDQQRAGAYAHQEEYRIRRPDGEIRWIWNRAFLVHGEHGQVIAVAGVASDVTAQKQAERALKERERQLAALLANLPGLAYRCRNDPAWTLEFASQGCQALMGYPAEALVGNRDVAYGDLIHPDEQQAVWDAVQAALAERKPFQLTYRIRCVDGAEKWVWEQGVGVYAEDGALLALEGFIIDATAQRRAEEQAAQLAQGEKLRALGQMASGVAHDLNQSLALVAGYADLARQELDRAPQYPTALGEALEVVARAALDGGEAVKRLLTFARGGPDGDAEQVDVARLLREVARLTAPRWRDQTQAEGRHISLYVEAEEGLVVEGHPASLREALTNLVFNAVDALPDGGGIVLRSRAEQDQVVLEVQDTGTGMPPEVQAKVFEPYFTTKGEKGTGLGLAQVFGIVEQHRGQITLSSLPGRGTTFRISLPLAAASAADTGNVDPRPQAGETTPMTAKQVRVLVVDDEPALARMATLMLGRAGHAVDTASSAEVALQRLTTCPYDLVISDLGLGEGMSGWDLAEVVRRRWPATRLALVTGWGAGIDPEEARRRGVDAVIPKPYRADTLTDTVAHLCTIGGMTPPAV